LFRIHSHPEESTHEGACKGAISGGYWGDIICDLKYPVNMANYVPGFRAVNYDMS